MAQAASYNVFPNNYYQQFRALNAAQAEFRMGNFHSNDRQISKAIDQRG